MNDAFESMREAQSTEGWTDATALIVAHEFIQEMHLVREYKKFLCLRRIEDARLAEDVEES